MRANVKRWLREGIVLLLMVGAVMLVMDQFRKPTLPQTFISQPLQTIDGQTLDIQALSAQRPLLVYVWATWCAVCRYTSPAVASLAKNGGNVVTVAMRSGNDLTLSHWLAKRRYAMPVVNDEQGRLYRQWQIQATPTLIVIYQGEVHAITTGFTSPWGLRLRLWWAGLS